MAITLEAIKQAKEQAKNTGKAIKLYAGDGVRLNVTAKSTSFQAKYRFKEPDGSIKQKTLTLGKLIARTERTLAQAIEDAIVATEEAKALAANGIDPIRAKRAERAKQSESQLLTLDKYFNAWVERTSTAAQWTPRHKRDMTSKFNSYVSPSIGYYPVNEIGRKDIAKVLDNLVAKPATYNKTRSLLNMLFEDALNSNKVELNPTPRGKATAVTKYKVKKLPAITDLAILQNLIAGIRKINLSPEVRTAALLQAYTALRSQSVIAAKWDEFDLTNAIWRIPRIKGRMKLSDADKYGEYFIVPLSEEVVSLLSEWRSTLRWGNSDYLFPSKSKNGHITIEALTKVYKLRLKTDEHCAHGWRSSFSTLAHEATSEDGKALFRADVIERCLDHVVGNEVTQAYNRGELLVLRKHLMSWWSKQLNLSNVVSLQEQKTI
ncbi:MAG: tyrosine-type recombinase/integrase [Gammaproteobacteria bacterium]|nr:tyrosine-type recombinase/integrase [Gammaproteobacteria bacterium]